MSTEGSTHLFGGRLHIVIDEYRRGAAVDDELVAPRVELGRVSRAHEASLRERLDERLLQ